MKKALISLEKGKKEKIGALLIKMGFLSEAQLLLALASKLNLRYVDLEEITPTQEAIAAISRQFAIKLEVVPVEIRGKTLVVATSELNDPFLEEYIKGIVLLVILFMCARLLAMKKN